MWVQNTTWDLFTEQISESSKSVNDKNVSGVCLTTHDASVVKKGSLVPGANSAYHNWYHSIANRHNITVYQYKDVNNSLIRDGGPKKGRWGCC